MVGDGVNDGRIMFTRIIQSNNVSVWRKSFLFYNNVIVVVGGMCGAARRLAQAAYYSAIIGRWFSA